MNELDFKELMNILQNNGDRSPHYEITGIADPDKLQSEIAGLCRQSFNIQIRPDLKVVPHEGKNILLIYIPEKEICSHRFIKPTDLGLFLKRNPEHLRNCS